MSLEDIQKKKAAGTLDDDDEVFVALCEMAGTTVEDAAAIKNFESVVARFEGASNKITNEIFKYWTQNKHLKVQFRLDPALPGDPQPFNTGRIFRTRIENQDDTSTNLLDTLVDSARPHVLIVVGDFLPDGICGEPGQRLP